MRNEQAAIRLSRIRLRAVEEFLDKIYKSMNNGKIREALDDLSEGKGNISDTMAAFLDEVVVIKSHMGGEVETSEEDEGWVPAHKNVALLIEENSVRFLDAFGVLYSRKPYTKVPADGLPMLIAAFEEGADKFPSSDPSSISGRRAVTALRKRAK